MMSGVSESAFLIDENGFPESVVAAVDGPTL
jgi:hypothetical protein